MFERLRRSVTARRADALAEIHMPVTVPRIPAQPGASAAARCAAAAREIAHLLERDEGVVLDAGTASGLDALIDSWGVRWVGEDDQEFAAYVRSLRACLGQVESSLAAAELAHRRTERGWTFADRDYLAARNRLGAPDPNALPPHDEPGDALGWSQTTRHRSASPFGRSEPPRSMP
jgi:hypothetical protein